MPAMAVRVRTLNVRRQPTEPTGNNVALIPEIAAMS
jgi:hypothetical protein